MIKLSTFCMESSTRLFNDIFLDVEHQMSNIISCMKDEYMWTFFGERIYRNACVTLFLHMCGKTLLPLFRESHPALTVDPFNPLAACGHG